MPKSWRTADKFRSPVLHWFGDNSITVKLVSPWNFCTMNHAESVESVDMLETCDMCFSGC